MIEFTKAYKTSDGETFAGLGLAQQHEIELIFKSAGNGSTEPWTVEEIANGILAHADKLVDILTTTASSKPRARSTNGGTKKRRTKAEIAAAAAATVTQDLK